MWWLVGLVTQLLLLGACHLAQGQGLGEGVSFFEFPTATVTVATRSLTPTRVETPLLPEATSTAALLILLPASSEIAPPPSGSSQLAPPTSGSMQLAPPSPSSSVQNTNLLLPLTSKGTVVPSTEVAVPGNSTSTTLTLPSISVLSSQVPQLRESSEFLLPMVSTDLLLPPATSSQALIPTSIPFQTTSFSFQASPSSALLLSSSFTPVEPSLSTSQTSSFGLFQPASTIFSSLGQTPGPSLQPRSTLTFSPTEATSTAAVLTQPLLPDSSQLAPPTSRSSQLTPPPLSSSVQNTNLLLPFSSEPPGIIITGAISTAPLTFTPLPLFPSTPSPSQPSTLLPSLTTLTPEGTATSPGGPLPSESVQFVMSSQTVDMPLLLNITTTLQSQFETTATTETSSTVQSVGAFSSTTAGSVVTPVMSSAVSSSRILGPPAVFSSLEVIESTEVLLLPRPSSVGATSSQLVTGLTSVSQSPFLPSFLPPFTPSSRITSTSSPLSFSTSSPLFSLTPQSLQPSQVSTQPLPLQSIEAPLSLSPSAPVAPTPSPSSPDTSAAITPQPSLETLPLTTAAVPSTEVAVPGNSTSTTLTLPSISVLSSQVPQLRESSEFLLPMVSTDLLLPLTTSSQALIPTSIPFQTTSSSFQASPSPVLVPSSRSASAPVEPATSTIQTRSFNLSQPSATTALFSMLGPSLQPSVPSSVKSSATPEETTFVLPFSLVLPLSSTPSPLALQSSLLSTFQAGSVTAIQTNSVAEFPSEEPSTILIPTTVSLPFPSRGTSVTVPPLPSPTSQVPSLTPQPSPSPLQITSDTLQPSLTVLPFFPSETSAPLLPVTTSEPVSLSSTAPVEQSPSVPSTATSESPVLLSRGPLTVLPFTSSPTSFTQTSSRRFVFTTSASEILLLPTAITQTTSTVPGFPTSILPSAITSERLPLSSAGTTSIFGEVTAVPTSREQASVAGTSISVMPLFTSSTVLGSPTLPTSLTQPGTTILVPSILQPSPRATSSGLGTTTAGVFIASVQPSSSQLTTSSVSVVFPPASVEVSSSLAMLVPIVSEQASVTQPETTTAALGTATILLPPPTTAISSLLAAPSTQQLSATSTLTRVSSTTLAQPQTTPTFTQLESSQPSVTQSTTTSMAVMSPLVTSSTSAALPLSRLPTITPLQPDISTVLPAIVGTEVTTTLVPAETASPIVTPSPSPSPSTPPSISPTPLCTPPPFPPTSDSRVIIVLGLIQEEYNELLIVGHPRRCRLQQALVEVFVMGRAILAAMVRRQTEQEYQAEILELGPLNNNQSSITFFVADVTSNQTVEGSVVVEAFTAANEQGLDTYPIIFPASLTGPTARDEGTSFFAILPLTISPEALIPTSIPFQTTSSLFQASPSSALLLSSSFTRVEPSISTSQTSSFGLFQPASTIFSSLGQTPGPSLQPRPTFTFSPTEATSTAAVLTQPLLPASSQLAPPTSRSSQLTPPPLSSSVQNTNLLLPFSSEPPGIIITGAISTAPLTFTPLPLFPSTPSPSQPSTLSPSLTTPTLEGTATSPGGPLPSESVQFVMSSQTVDIPLLLNISTTLQSQFETTATTETSSTVQSVGAFSSTTAGSVVTPVTSSAVSSSRILGPPAVFSSLEVIESTEVLLLPRPSSVGATSSQLVTGLTSVSQSPSLPSSLPPFTPSSRITSTSSLLSFSTSSPLFSLTPPSLQPSQVSTQPLPLQSIEAPLSLSPSAPVAPTPSPSSPDTSAAITPQPSLETLPLTTAAVPSTEVAVPGNSTSTTLTLPSISVLSSQVPQLQESSVFLLPMVSTDLLLSLTASPQALFPTSIPFQTTSSSLQASPSSALLLSSSFTPVEPSLSTSQTSSSGLFQPASTIFSSLGQTPGPSLQPRPTLTFSPTEATSTAAVLTQPLLPASSQLAPPTSGSSQLTPPPLSSSVQNTNLLLPFSSEPPVTPTPSPSSPDTSAAITPQPSLETLPLTTAAVPSTEVAVPGNSTSTTLTLPSISVLSSQVPQLRESSEFLLPMVSTDLLLPLTTSSQALIPTVIPFQTTSFSFQASPSPVLVPSSRSASAPVEPATSTIQTRSFDLSQPSATTALFSMLGPSLQPSVPSSVESSATPEETTFVLPFSLVLPLSSTPSPLALQSSLLSTFQAGSVTAIQTSSVAEFPSEEPSTILIPTTVSLPFPSRGTSVTVPPLPSPTSQVPSLTPQPSPSPLQITSDTLQPSLTVLPFFPSETSAPLLPVTTSEPVSLSSTAPVEQSPSVPSTATSESSGPLTRGPLTVLPFTSFPASFTQTSSELFIFTTSASEILLLPTAITQTTSTVPGFPTSILPSAVTSERLPLSSAGTTSIFGEVTTVLTSREQPSVAGTSISIVPLFTSSTVLGSPTLSTSLTQPGITVLVPSILQPSPSALEPTSSGQGVTTTQVPIGSVQLTTNSTSVVFPPASVEVSSSLAMLVPTVSEQASVTQSETTTAALRTATILPPPPTTAVSSLLAAPSTQQSATSTLTRVSSTALASSLTTSVTASPATAPITQLSSTQLSQSQTTPTFTQLESSQPSVTQPTTTSMAVMSHLVTSSTSAALPLSRLPTVTPLQPDISTVLPATVGAEVTTTLVPAETASPIVTPSPLPSPSPSTPPSISPTPLCTPPPFPPTSDSRVIIVLGLIQEEYNELLIVGHPRRCRLQQALVEVFVMGRAILEAMVRRQTEEEYQAEILDLGPLNNGQSSITFFVADVTSNLTVEGSVVVEAFTAANVQEVDTYPIFFPASLTGPTADDEGTSLIAIVAGVAGGVILALVLVVIMLCVGTIWYRKKRDTVRVSSIHGLGEAGTFRPTDDFQSFSTDVQQDMPTSVRQSTVSLAHLANDRVEPEQVPVALFERVAHYDTPQPSPPTRAQRMRFRTAVAPLPSTSQKSQKSESEEHMAERQSRDHRLREDALRLQEEREEQEIKARKKDTLERLLLQSRQSELRSRTGSRRRKKLGAGVAAVGTQIRPSTYGGLRHVGAEGEGVRMGRREGEGVEGDIEASSPAATPLQALPASSSRPNTRRRRKKVNHVGPMPVGHTTDGYDSTDHRPYPRMPASRQLRKFKLGHSSRARPLTRLSTTGRLSRGVAQDVHQELAWMNTGAGVQLMRIQPVQYSLPTHPPHPPMVAVQPRSAWDKLPTVAPPLSQSYSRRQWETYYQVHKDMDELSLDRSGTLQPTPAPGPTYQTPDHAHPPRLPIPQVHKDMDELPLDRSGTLQPTPAPGPTYQTPNHTHQSHLQPSRTSPTPLPSLETPEVTVKQKRPKEPPKRGVALGEEERTGPEVRPPGQRPLTQTPLGSASVPNLDSSFSTQEILQQAFDTSSQAQGVGFGRVTSVPLAGEDELEQVIPPWQPVYHNPAPAVAWHAVQPQPFTPAHQHTPTAITYHPFAQPPQHSGQLVWSPDSALAPHMTPMLTPAQLTQLRSTSSLGRHDYNTPGGHDQFRDSFHTPQYHTIAHSHVRSRTRRDHFL